MNKERMSVKGLIRSFNYAIDGIIHSIKYEKNMKVHVIIALIVMIASIFMGVTKIELAVLAATISLVLVAEMLNTAVEEVVDLLEKNYNVKAKIAKDVAAGGVLFAAANSLFVGYIIFSGKITLLTTKLFISIRKSDRYVGLLVIGIILLSVVFLKSVFSKDRGTHLQGGAVSGHSALAFSIATMIGFLVENGFVVLLAFLMASLVAQSRVEGGIHKTRDVIVGGLWGILVTLLIFKLLVR